MPARNTSPLTARNPGSSNSVSAMGFRPRIFHTTGCNRMTRTTASATLNRLMRPYSTKYCAIRWRRDAPTTLRMPTSLARSSDRASVRLTKFIHAMPRMTKAKMPIAQTERRSPLGTASIVRLEFRWMPLNACR